MKSIPKIRSGYFLLYGNYQFYSMKSFKHVSFFLKVLFFVLLSLLQCHNAFCFEKDVLNLVDDTKPVPVGKYIYLLIDKAKNFNDKNIIESKNFKIQKRDIPIIVTVNEGNVWAKFSVFNSLKDSSFFFGPPIS
jgi:hypothetical protein